MKENPAEDLMAQQAPLYILGALSEDEARAFEEHVSAGCDACNAELETFSAVIEKLAFDAPVEEPPSIVRTTLLKGLSEEEQLSRAASAHRLSHAQSMMAIRSDEGEWVEQIKGVFTKHLFTDEARGTVTTLYRMLPGARLPDHRHLGVEECIILEGDFNVNGESFGPGDYRCALSGSDDRELYTKGGALFLIVAPESCEFLTPVGK